MSDTDLIFNTIKQRDIKIKKVAKDIDVHPNTLSRIKSGNRNLTREMRLRLFTYLNLN